MQVPHPPVRYCYVVVMYGTTYHMYYTLPLPPRRAGEQYGRLRLTSDQHTRAVEANVVAPTMLFINVNFPLWVQRRATEERT